MKSLKYLMNEKGTGILSYILVIAVTIVIAVSILPIFQETVKNRSSKIINVFNSTDTIIVD